MKKYRFIYLVIISLCFINTLHADNTMGFGLQIGVHHNVGNYGSEDSSILLDPQNNYFAGFGCKTNFACLFARFGIDSTYLINKGSVLEESSAEIDKYTIHYFSIPFFFGFNYTILDIGNYYMGPGLSFFMGKGKINCTDPALSEEIDANAIGTGFIAGIELDITPSIRCYFEWQYYDGRSLAVQKTQNTHNWNNFHIDYSGHRLVFGVMYYII